MRVHSSLFSSSLPRTREGRIVFHSVLRACTKDLGETVPHQSEIYCSVAHMPPIYCFLTPVLFYASRCLLLSSYHNVRREHKSPSHNGLYTQKRIPRWRIPVKPMHPPVPPVHEHRCRRCVLDKLSYLNLVVLSAHRRGGGAAEILERRDGAVPVSVRRTLPNHPEAI